LKLNNDDGKPLMAYSPTGVFCMGYVEKEGLDFGSPSETKDNPDLWVTLLMPSTG
jgi:hypothetical protein